MNDDQDDLEQEKLDQMNYNTPASRAQRFLDVIGQMESSGGQNFQHRPIVGGIQSGTSAMGTYGLMPNTVQEMAHRAPSSDITALSQLPPDQMKQNIETNPALENQVAQQLAQHVLNREGNEDKAAYAWHMGHNLGPQQIEQRGYLDNPYVREFQRIKNSLGRK